MEVGNSAQVQVPSQHVDDAAEDGQSEVQDDADDENDDVNTAKQSKLAKTQKMRGLPRKVHYDSVFTLCKNIDTVHQPHAHAVLDYRKGGGLGNVTIQVSSHLQHGLRHMMREQIPDHLLTKISEEMKEQGQLQMGTNSTYGTIHVRKQLTLLDMLDEVLTCMEPTTEEAPAVLDEP